MQEAKTLDRAISTQPKPPSDSSAQDRQFYVSFGLIVSARLGDVEKIRKAIESLGGKIAFQTVTSAPLYVLRHYQIEQILRGDISHVREIHERKQKERRVEK
jgi:hypothetical protein